MRKSVVAGSLLLWLLWVPAGSQLLAAADDLVISLDYRGERLRRLVDDPTLSIFADGRVAMPQIYPHSQSYRYQLRPDALRELLDFVEEQGFFLPDFVPPRSPSAPVSHDASVTVVFAAQPHRSRQHAVRDLHHHPDARGLQRVVDRLESLMTMIKLGGEDAAQTWLLRANAELHAVHPERRAMTLDNLHSGALRPDGSGSVVFARLEDGVKVSISIGADGRSGVAVFPRP